MVSWTHPEKEVSRLNSDALVTHLPSSSLQYRSATGEIYSDNEEVQKDLNETLNLNSDKHMLKINRKQLLNQVILQLRTLQKSGN